VHSAWRTPHDVTDEACPECQGSSYVPAPTDGERIVKECPECEGTGKGATKQAA